MLPVPDLDDASVAFGDISALPAYGSLPKEYREGWFNGFGGTEVASSLFYKGGKMSDHGLKPREGVDPVKALRVIQACLCSWAPKHEHKIARVGYLIDQWFEKAES